MHFDKFKKEKNSKISKNLPKCITLKFESIFFPRESRKNSLMSSCPRVARHVAMSNVMSFLSHVVSLMSHVASFVYHVVSPSRTSCCGVARGVVVLHLVSLVV